MLENLDVNEDGYIDFVFSGIRVLKFDDDNEPISCEVIEQVFLYNSDSGCWEKSKLGTPSVSPADSSLGE